MEQPDPLNAIQPAPPVRTLQIEADGDPWKGLLKPKIRLMGRWLERAGFKPGYRVQVVCVAPGVIELRSPDTMSRKAVEQRPSEQVKVPS